MSCISIKIDGNKGELIIPRVSIDAQGVEKRAGDFTSRSLKGDTKLELLRLAITMTDLTTLEGADTSGKVESLCLKAISPMDSAIQNRFEISAVPSVAAVCVYPSMVPVAKRILRGTKIEIASVATAFPSGQLPLSLKLKEVKKAIEFGASEIDMVIDRGAFLMGDYQKVYDEIVAIKKVCLTTAKGAHLKVILETGELQTYDSIRLASTLAMEAGADFIKTSTGKIAPAATMPVTLVMLQAIWDFYDRTGKMIGMKPAGGIRTAKQALHYLVMLDETLGEKWMTPKLFRFGASSLLNDLLRQIVAKKTGRYIEKSLFSVD